MNHEIALPVSAPMMPTGPQQPQGPQQQQQAQGNIKFTVMQPNGRPGFVNEQTILRDLQQMGYQPAGISPDGMTVKFQGGQEVPITDVIGKMGHEVQGVAPANANYDNVSMKHRAIIELPGINDDEKKMLLESRLKREGIEQPSIIGQGSDWFSFNPMTNRWDALTNKPGADLSDLSEVATSAPRILGSMAGGGAGAAAGAGLGSIPLGAAGGAVGGQLGDAATAGLGMMVDDDYRNMIDNKGLGDIAREQAPKALMDAAGGGLGGLLSKAAPALWKGGAAATSAKVPGAIADAAGSVAEKAGGYVANASRAAAEGTETLGQGLAAGTAANHIFGPAAFAGDLLKMPGQIIGAAPRAAGWIADAMERIAPNRASDALKGFASRYAGTEGGADVLRRAASNAAGDIAGAGTRGGLGMPAEKAAAMAEEAYSPWAKGVEAMDAMGNKINQGIYGATGVLGSAVEAGGKALGAVGRGATKLGQYGKYETPAELQSLKFYLDQKRKAERKRALQAASSGSNISPTLASTN